MSRLDYEKAERLAAYLEDALSPEDRRAFEYDLVRDEQLFQQLVSAVDHVDRKSLWQRLAAAVVQASTSGSAK